MEQNYQKMKMALRYRLQGKGYTKALEAMALAEKYHSGTRKDGSAEFSHQVSIVSYAMTLTHVLSYEEDLICILFLHDTPEDYNLSYDEMRAKFGRRVAQGAMNMSKVDGDKTLPNDVYYGILKKDVLTALAKGFDRAHNLMTMLHGFKPAKQERYILETEEYVVPMLKIARRDFPSEELIFENIKFVMTNQLRLYKALLKETLELSK